MRRHGTERPHNVKMDERLVAQLSEKYCDAMMAHFLEKYPFKYDAGDPVGNVIVLERVIGEEWRIDLFKKNPDNIDAIHQKSYRVFDYLDKKERVLGEEEVTNRIPKPPKSVAP